ncbi:DUF748 domain-containing protein [uncultured Sutterella sp.]|uniref:DUF748 domain-containing protein n=1 Tax=uncultured Sutterella sp. TaxID=286133 RepID=UPI00261C8DF1|nr:DUF748 domain-containing protein [uncultured Sutterella sp.]
MAKVLKFTACAAAVAVALYAGAGYVGVPYATRTVLEKVVSQELGREVTLSDVSFNPWTLVYELRGLSIPEAGSDPLLRLDLLRVDASIQTLFKLAPVIEEVTIDGLRINAVMNEKNRRDVERLMGKSGTSEKSGSAEKKSEASSGLPQFAVYNISVTNSSLSYRDDAQKINQALTDLTLKLPFVSTMESASESLVTPELAFKLNGSQIEATGSTKPFGTTLEARLNFKVSALDVAELARIVPALNSDNLRVADAKLSSDLTFVFRNPTGGNPAKMLLSGTTSLANVSVTQKESPIVTLPKAELNLNELDLVDQRAVVENLTLTGLRLDVRNSKAGINLLTAAQSAAGGTAEAKPEEKKEAAQAASSSSPWTWKVVAASLRDANISWTDSTLSPAAKITVANLDASVKNLSSDVEKPGSFSVSAELLGGRIEGSGTAQISPLAVSAAAKGTRLSLNAAAPYITKALGADVRAGIAFDVKADLKGSDVAASGTATLNDFTLKEGKSTLASFKTATLKLNSVDTARRSADVALVSLASPVVNAVMTKSGINFAKLAGSGSESKTQTEAKPSSKAEANSPAWSWKVAQASVTNGTLNYRDESISPVGTASIPKLNLTVKNLSSAKGNLGTVDFSSGLGGGSLNAAGKFGISPVAADIEVKGSKIGLKPFSALMTGYAGIGAKSGTFDASGRMKLASQKEKTIAGWKGDLSLSTLDLTNSKGTGLMSWKKASLTGLEVETTEPIHLVVAKAEIDQPAQKQVAAVKEIAGIASLISSLTGKDKTAQKIEKYSEKIPDKITLENVRYENGKFSAEGVSAASVGGILLNKLSEAMSEKLGGSSSATSTTK